ncbi:MAG: uracil-DNA glycosylase [SAR324 cluster bacterium]|nr:uracil-DNA glycosylase [SAR324 cluster bacterium]
MDYPTLLLQLENQLQSLHKKGFDYMNIEAMPKVELRRLLEGLGIIGSSHAELQNKVEKSSFSFSEQSQSAVETKEHNSHPSILPPSTGISDFQDKLSSAKQQTITEAFAQMATQKTQPKAAENLSELAQQNASCKRCNLAKTRTNLVFGSGLSSSPVLFIGEGPGADEDAQGEPFVGRAGRLLTKMINTIGIEREDVYISNIVKCRPPENRNPTPAEISCCLPIIRQQIEIINPKLIVTLGNVPTKTLIPELPGITKVRGRILQYANWTMLPTFHPSYLLRNRSAMPLAWEDFKKIPELAFIS